ncbi:uncharacterized protein LOC125654511 [Ostrea edulis]|uniref:uncharacterized protein LOC125654511 n=1 Tax=Ostrea edulis TaxID=37623 RepID=UPI002094C487|nr:uncharacterized protein LOC125654511 [Ostrea edulis]
MRALLVVCFIINLFHLSFQHPDKRQGGLVPNCGDTWSHVPNPCSGSSSSHLYYPHPRDSTKFIQCTANGEMYLIQCPAGKIYYASVSHCAQPITTTAPPPSFTNPCTSDAFFNSAGVVYFPYPSDNTKFIVCEGVGHANIMSCPSPLVWDESRKSCVYTLVTAGQTPPHTATTVAPDYLALTCQKITVPIDGVYFSHPIPSKFIQCGPGGTAYVLSCPQGTVWNEFDKRCVSPFITATPPTAF